MQRSDRERNDRAWRYGSGLDRGRDCRFEAYMDLPAQGQRMELAALTSLDIAFNTSIPVELVITDAAMQIFQWWGGGPGLSMVRSTLPAGSFILWVVSGSGSPVSYQLTVAPGRPVCTGGAGPSITVGATVSGMISAADCLFYGEYPATDWRLELEATTRIGVELTSTAFDALVAITDLHLDVVAWGYADGSGQADLIATLPAGSYMVWAMSVDELFGAFELSVQIAEPYSCPVAPTPISIGQTVQGTITHDSCRLESGTYGVGHSITLDQSTTLRVDLTSNQVDTVILLTDEDGAWIAFDDDGGVGTNSRLIVSLAAGSYTVWATTFFQGETGSYQLSVVAASAAAALQLEGAAGSGSASRREELLRALAKRGGGAL
jgi:hypothetical protein